MFNSKKKTISVLLVIGLVAFVLFQTNLYSSAQSIDDSSDNGTYIISLDKEALDWIRIDDTSAINLINQLLEEEVPVSWALEDFKVGGTNYPAGTFYIETPFTTRKGIKSNEVMSWLSWKGKTNRVFRIEKTTEEINVESKELVLPRIALFYDRTTYSNALACYNRLREFGFKVFFVNAVDLLADPWNKPGTALDNANVFFMPGGALHFWSFPTENQRENGIKNIQQFVDSGGGYVGVCAGATETLKGSPYPYLNLVDASYHPEWFANDRDWRQLIGPIEIGVTKEDHPVMFGYGSDAVRPGYGPETPIYYYGGPAMHSLGEETEKLAEFSNPITQVTPDLVKNIWGNAAIVAQDYGEGKTVLISPHPEWPGPAGRIFAQALYYNSSKEKPSWQDANLSTDLPDEISSERVANITKSVDEIKPYLEDTARVASEIVNLRAGDHYHPLGLWYDEPLRMHANDIYDKLKFMERSALKFEYEYYKLNLIKQRVKDDPRLLETVEYSQAMIDKFFTLAEKLSSEPHFIYEDHWTGAGPFEPFGEYEPSSFTDFPAVFKYIDEEVNEIVLPFVENYAVLFNDYKELQREYEIDPSPELKLELENMENMIAASWPAGPLYKGMYTLRHTLDIMQYKVNYHLLKLVSHADRVEEVLSLNNYILADSLGQFSNTYITLRSLFAHPGGFLK